MRNFIIILISLTSFLAHSQNDVLVQDELKAFPTAQGRGAGTSGGRGGKLIIVNTLSTANTGSYDSSCDCYRATFKWAMEAPFKATVVFSVSGVINYTSEFSLYYDQNDTIYPKTIIGGTAPRPGIIIYGTRFQFSGSDVNQIIFRGFTVFKGDEGKPGTHTALSLREVNNLIYSDMTLGWSYDQIGDLIDSKSGTKQRNMHIEAHPNHNTGGIIGANTGKVGTTPERTGQQVSSHHNLYSHVSHRFDNAAGNSDANIDIINNVAYNFNSRLVRVNCSPKLNHIGNYYKPGPRTSTNLSNKLNKWSPVQDSGNTLCDINNLQIFTDKNYIDGYFTDIDASNQAIWQIFLTANGYTQNDPLPNNFFNSAMHDLGQYPINIDNPQEAFDRIVTQKNVGARYYTDSNGRAVKYFPSFVEEYIDDAINGTDAAFRDNTDLFVVPTLDSPTTPYTDSDSDGIADTFEDINGMDKNDHTDAMATTSRIWNIPNGLKYRSPEGMEAREVYFAYIQGDFEEEMVPYIGGSFESLQPKNCPNTSYAITASDSDGGNIPCNLVDDDLNTRWGAQGDGEWVMFDLGSVQEINQMQVAFYRGSSRTADFNVQVSNDTTTWTDVYGAEQQSSGMTLELQDFNFPLQNARYVRYLGHGNSENQWNSLQEMRINRISVPAAGCPGTPYNITASDSVDEYIPCNLVDDDLNTRWGALGDGKWVMFDLGSIQEVNQLQVAFYRGASRTANFNVEVSIDNAMWTDVYGEEQQSSGTTLQLQDFNFPLQNARYVRYIGYGNSENQWNSLQEMRVNRTIDSQEVTLEPIHDAYLQGSSRFNNELLKVNLGSRKVYLKYDLAAVNGEIIGAELRFRLSTDTGSGTAEVHKASNTNWTETNLGNSNKPSETALWGTTTDLRNTSTDVVVPLTTGNFFGGGTLNLIVNHAGGDDFAFASKENTTVPAPRLILTYRPSLNLRAKITGTSQPDSLMLRLYPNPTTSDVTIRGMAGPKEIVILDFSGKALYRETSVEPEPKLDLSSYAPGSYFIKIVGEVRNETFKVIKK